MTIFSHIVTFYSTKYRFTNESKRMINLYDSRLSIQRLKWGIHKNN